MQVPMQMQPMGIQPTVMAIQTQPGMPIAAAGGQFSWMARPTAIPGCPPGLEYLTQVDHLLVQQQVEMLEAVSGFEECNKYRVFNSVGQQVYYAFEESSMCQRFCCGTHREFVIHLVDNSGTEVARILRPFKCFAAPGCFACCDCCQYEVTVESPPGNAIGYASTACYCCSPHFHIMDAAKVPRVHIEGPCVMMPSCPCDQDFNLMSSDGDAKIGKISKKFSGFAQEVFTDADNFGVSFPRDLDVNVKATTLGVLFLIDFMFFEKSGNGRKK